MDKDKLSHHAPEIEHTFCAESNKCNNSDDSDNSYDKLAKLHANLYAELKKGVNVENYKKIKQRLDKLLVVLAQEIEKEYKKEAERRMQELNLWASELVEKIEKEYEEKNKRYKKNRRIVIGISLVWLIFVTFLFRNFFPPKYIDTTLFGVVGSVITIIFEAHSKIGQEIAHIKDKSEPMTTGIFKVGMAIFQTIKTASLLHLVLLVWGTTILGEYLGSINMVENAYTFVTAGYSAVKNEDEDVFVAAQVDEEIQAIILAGCDETTIILLQRADITLAELNVITELSQNDKDLVFFLDQEDIDWTDQDEVNAVVLQKVNEYLSMQKENEFDKDEKDGGAPQWLRNLVAQASEDEANAKSFIEIKYIRDVRAEAYDQFPKKSLAQLLSNDNQKLAIILYLNGGEEDSIIYYFSQSILRDFQCLQFAQNSNDTVKGKLKSIAQRYRDMVYTCPDMDNLENVQALAEAFENAANQY